MPSGRLRELLADGRTDFGTMLTIPAAGLDFVIVDRQHGLLGEDAVIAVMHGISRTGVTPLVRTLANNAAEIGWALDVGADGVIAAEIHSAEDVASAVAACRYPPRGRRSIGQIRASMFTKGSLAEVEEKVICIALIESVAAVDAIDEICAVEGLDGVMIGHVDLSIDLGVPLELSHRKLLAAVEKVVTASESADLPYCRSTPCRGGGSAGSRGDAEGQPLDRPLSAARRCRLDARDGKSVVEAERSRA